jgi:hypothetical protein
MTDDEAKQLIADIINKPQEYDQLKFKYITYWNEFIYYYKLYISTKALVKILTNSANRLFKAYCKDVTLGTSDVSKLLAYSQLQDIIAFYEADVKTMKSMLDEYDEYLGKGHFWHSFLGGERILPWDIH